MHQGTVLYLALEDDFQRIQSRMFRMYGVEDTSDLHFATAAGKVGNGLDEQLANFMREHPDTKLIIIDTMQKIRETGGEAYSYASDYEIIGKLKAFADRYGICLLTVHHTRKQPAGDAFEMISGTTGLLGCADGSLLMQKKNGRRWKQPLMWWDGISKEPRFSIMKKRPLKHKTLGNWSALGKLELTQMNQPLTRFWKPWQSW